MADSEWVDVTDKHVAPKGGDEWEDVTHEHATGVPSIPTPLTKKGRDRAMIDEAMAKPGDITRAVENGVSMMGGGGLTKAFGEKAAGMLGNAAEGAMMGSAQAEPDNRGTGAAVGAALPVALGGVGKALGKSAQYLIQKATGVREPSEKIGQALLDEGLRGTRAGMQRQVASRISDNGRTLQDAVSSIPGDIDVAPVEQVLRGKVDKLSLGGEMAPNIASQAKNYTDLADFLRGKGKMSPQDLLKFKQQQGDAAYLMSGNPASSDAAQAARTAMGESGDLIKGRYAEANPGQANVVADTNDKLAALFKAKSGMKRGESLSGLAQMGGLGAVGGMIGGAPGAVLGAAMKTPLVQSNAAQLADLLGKGTGKIDPAVLRTMILSNSNKD